MELNVRFDVNIIDYINLLLICERDVESSTLFTTLPMREVELRVFLIKKFCKFVE